MSRALPLLIAVTLVTVPNSTSEIPKETHCIIFVVDQEADGELVMSQPICFEDESVADLWAAEGSPRIVRGETSATTGQAMMSSFTLGKHYDGSSGTGSSITVVGSSCTGGWWNTSTSWDNRISSSYNGCARLTHWDDANKGGSSESTYGVGTTDNLGYMNNKAESVSYHSS